MEDISFDISGILSDEEAEKLFDEQKQTTAPDVVDDETEQKADEEMEEIQDTQEEVGGKNNETREDATQTESDGSSPNVYSSIADALRKDDIFPNFTDEEIEAVKTPEDFAELFKRAIREGEDARTSRVNDALDNGVAPDIVKNYEETLSYLNSLSNDDISAEGEEGENIRRRLIYNDLTSRGYSHEKALKELEKSFKSGSDVDDAIDALESLKSSFSAQYQKIQDDAKEKAEAAKESQKKKAEEFRKMIFEDEIKIGDSVLDKRTCQKVFDAVTTPTYKDTKTGNLLTEVQKFQLENPLEFLKQIGMWFVLTDGGKNLDGFTKEYIRKEKNKSIAELGRKINSTSLNKDGSLKYAGGSSIDSDPLLSEGWKVGW